MPKLNQAILLLAKLQTQIDERKSAAKKALSELQFVEALSILHIEIEHANSVHEAALALRRTSKKVDAGGNIKPEYTKAFASLETLQLSITASILSLKTAVDEITSAQSKHQAAGQPLMPPEPLPKAPKVVSPSPIEKPKTPNQPNIEPQVESNTRREVPENPPVAPPSPVPIAPIIHPPTPTRVEAPKDQPEPGEIDMPKLDKAIVILTKLNTYLEEKRNEALDAGRASNFIEANRILSEAITHADPLLKEAADLRKKSKKTDDAGNIKPEHTSTFSALDAQQEAVDKVYASLTKAKAYYATCLKEGGTPQVRRAKTVTSPPPEPPIIAENPTLPEGLPPPKKSSSDKAEEEKRQAEFNKISHHTEDKAPPSPKSDAKAPPVTQVKPPLEAAASSPPLPTPNKAPIPAEPMPSEESSFTQALVRLKRLRNEPYKGHGEVTKELDNLIAAIEKAKHDGEPIQTLKNALEYTTKRLTNQMDSKVYRDHAHEMQGHPSTTLKTIAGLMLALSIALVICAVIFTPLITSIGVAVATGASVALATAALTATGVAFFAKSLPSGLSQKMLDTDKSALEKGAVYPIQA